MICKENILYQGYHREENVLKSVLIIFEQPLFRIELKQEASLKNPLFICFKTVMFQRFPLVQGCCTVTFIFGIISETSD